MTEIRAFALIENWPSPRIDLLYPHLTFQPNDVISQGGQHGERTVAESCVGRGGLIFSGLVYPLTMFVRQDPALAMMMSLYVTLGIFFVLAALNPSANRSLIAFTARSSFVHAILVAVRAFAGLIARAELVGSAVLVVIGVALIMLAPAKQTAEKTSVVTV